MTVPGPGPAEPARHLLRRAVLGLPLAVACLVAAGCAGAAVRPSATGVAGATPVPATAPAVSASPTASPAPLDVPSPTAEPPRGPTTDPATWPLAWSDEFDGEAGTPPDSTKWTYDVGGSGWGNNELQFYTTDVANASLDGKGHLRITARASDGSLGCHYGPCDYTSARLLTKGRLEVQYGRIEARIRVPGGFGLWPAFWMLGADIDSVSWPASGEIDVMEYVGRRPTEVLGTIHGPGYSASSGISGFVDLGTPVSDGFHVFSIEWWPDRIAWYLDGVLYHEASPDDVAPNDWVFDHPFFLILNVAVGGNLGGPVFPDTVFPSSMVVDYVRIYQEVTP